MDRLASQGVKLEHFYAEALCTPSRTQILTGRHPWRYGLNAGVFDIQDLRQLDEEEHLLPQYLQEAGYSTYLVGKWHLGFYKKEALPTMRGFDDFFGLLSGESSHHDYSGGTGPQDPKPSGYDLYSSVEGWAMENSTGWTQWDFGNVTFDLMDRHVGDARTAEKPMYFFLALTDLHNPIQLPQEAEDPVLNNTKCAVLPVDGSDPAFLNPGASDDPDTTDECVEYGLKTCKTGKTKRQYLCGMAVYVDNFLGDLETKLKAEGTWDNTVIVVHGDNGGNIMDSASNYPYDGYKATIFEGGIRNAGFVTGGYLERSLDAANVPRGYEHRDSIEGTDWFATFLHLANATHKIHKERVLDSVNVWDSITRNVTSPRNYVVVGAFPEWFNSGVAVVRKDGWKLVINPDNFPSWSLHRILQNCFTMYLSEPRLDLAEQCAINQQRAYFFGNVMFTKLTEYADWVDKMWYPYQELMQDGSAEVVKRNLQLSYDLLDFTTYESSFKDDQTFFGTLMILLNVNENSTCIKEYDPACNMIESTDPEVLKIRDELEGVVAEVMAQRVPTTWTPFVDPWVPWVSEDCTYMSYWRDVDLNLLNPTSSCFNTTLGVETWMLNEERRIARHDFD
eukprot:gene5734-6922_t